MAAAGCGGGSGGGSPNPSHQPAAEGAFGNKMPWTRRLAYGRHGLATGIGSLWAKMRL